MLHTVSVAVSYTLDTVQPWGFTSVQKWNVLWTQSVVSGPNIEDLSMSRYALCSLKYHAISISVIHFRGSKHGYHYVHDFKLLLWINAVSHVIHSFHWHVQNATIPCRSQELRPFLSVMYPFYCHPSPPTILPSSLTSSCHLFLGLPLYLVVPKFI
jgi:hypothetical protein